MDKNVKTLLLTAGTAFVSTAMILVTAQNYLEAGVLGGVGMLALFIREYMKDDPIQI